MSSGLGGLYLKALTGFTKRGGELPARVYERVGVAVDAGHLASYSQVCGFRLSDELPATYLHVVAFPLQVRLMTDADFPFPLIGSVHVANRIVQHRPVGVGERVDLRVHVENLRPHPKGTQFDMISSAAVDGAVVWHGTSTYLRRGPGAGSPVQDSVPLPGSRWSVPGDIGRRYAAVSGDRNPIHLHPLAARAFGFRRAIAHGMWSKARCLAAFEGRLPGGFEVDVRFKLPVMLPAVVGFYADHGTGRFGLTDVGGTRPYLSGVISSL
ncbi:MaoC/PaaZ C-terminal domain-containing protein [Actinokineospora cianjurensis]|uniref:MaoC dehydratase-like protein n=1 Tax=Actinokineospora cianjurensis TaxID=585224 RepID=A0A421B7U6_9PSEU|nr:MaoC/PaaZ C-terminal domain-containing protein [Actinokineospora cianjurensis]RLK60290.1 MaoC dehydratase-like protein [Actinokineospora cianjurensis]